VSRSHVEWGCALLLACTPTLNWRSVSLGHLSTLLPCKPDEASRKVTLANTPVVMDMLGCEAGGTVFTVSRIQAPDATQASALLAALRQASLQTVQAGVVQPQPNSGDQHSSLDLQAEGRNPQGQPLQARFKWLLAGAEVYQLAAYGAQLTGLQTDNLTQEARLQ